MHFPQAIDATGEYRSSATALSRTVTLNNFADEDYFKTDIDGVPRLKDYHFTKTWAAMEDVYLNSKKVKAIGVSNFSIKK